MKLKNNNMLVAGDFFEQTAKIYPESIDNKDDLKQSERDYKPIVEEIKKINPDFQFDYSSYPALTILDKDNNALAFGVHPDVRISFLGEYACANGIFNSAFENKKLYDDVAKAMAVMGGDVQALSIRNDLGEEYQQVAKNMLRAVL
ncbi:TPA: hypothetical protein VEN67_006751, partial [Pseudomonas aeruginosa]|nr:hypothetical protein [Pseudomonas aeruginosa]